MVGDRDGLKLRVALVQANGVIAAETRVENNRDKPAFLVPDQCGRVTEALLVRTKFQPVGRTWPKSLQALKRLVLVQQESSQEPEPLAPRRPGDGSQAAPRCDRPGRVVKLAAGAAIRERWQVEPYSTPALDAVGSQNAKLRVEVVEARGGRRLRLEAPASAVLGPPPTAAGSAASAGQLFDQLLEHRGLRSWLASQPAGSWRSAQLLSLSDGIEFSAVTSGYERAVLAQARPTAAK